MSLKERVYSVLVVSSSDSINTAMSSLLPESDYSPVHYVSSISSAKRAFAERSFDFIIVNSPLPDDSGIRFAIDCCESKVSVVLLLVRNDIHGEIFEKVAPHGVFTLPRPTAKSTISMALSWLTSARERLRGTEKKTVSLEQKMKEIRTINRAKWVLISELSMDEEAAHHYIEKLAMDKCISKVDAANEIIKTYV